MAQKKINRRIPFVLIANSLSQHRIQQGSVTFVGNGCICSVLDQQVC